MSHSAQGFPLVLYLGKVVRTQLESIGGNLVQPFWANLNHPLWGSLCNPFGKVRTALVSEIMGPPLVYKNICSLSPHRGEIAIAHGVRVGMGNVY